MSIEIIDSNSGQVVFTTGQLAAKFNVSVSNIRLMRRIHGHYRQFIPIKQANRLYWRRVESPKEVAL